MPDDSSRKRDAAASFGAHAAGYRTSEPHREGADLETLAAWCRGRTRALDVATGAGHTAGALLDVGVASVVASDAAVEMVETCVDAFPAVDGVVADAERLPFDADAFDAVTCRIAAHHFPNPERFVAEVARVLRPGGVFALEDNVVPDDDALASFLDRLERLRDPTHVRSYRTATWQRWLAAAGFSVTATDHLLKPIAVDPWLARTSPGEDAEREIRRLLSDAPAAAVSFYDVRYVDGEVTSFQNLKALLRAVYEP